LGVGISSDTSQGINFCFRNNSSAGQSGPYTAFLDDFREWGPSQNFAWENQVWYWMRLRQEPNAASEGGVKDVFAKMWRADGTVPEPAGWQLTWDYTPARSTRTGYAGILASSENGVAEFEVDYILIKAAGLPNILVAPSAVLQNPVTITNQPQDQTVMELMPVEFRVGASGIPRPTYQWFRDESPLPSATNASYSLTRSALSETGARFQVVASNVISNITHSVTSRVATLTVLADRTPPVLLDAWSLGLNQVQLVFSERLAPGPATNLAHYALAGPEGNVTILQATLDTTQTNVLLQVGALIENAPYTLTVDNLTDQAAAVNLIAAHSQIGFWAKNYLRCDIGGAAQPTLVRPITNGYAITAGGRDIGGTADQFHFSYQPRAGDFDVRVRLKALSATDPWSKAGLMARQSTNADSRFVGVLATPGLGGTFFVSRTSPGNEAVPAGHFPINYPYTWLRLQRTGNLFSGSAGLDGEHWALLGSVSLALADPVYVGMAVASHDASYGDACGRSGPALGTPG